MQSLQAVGNKDKEELCTAIEKPSLMAATLLIVVVAVLLLPIGIILRQSLAAVPAAGEFSIATDTLSDSVAAIPASFRVDESGAATYSIPLFTVAGRAGVAPQLSLNYSSQGNAGPLGKGWAIGGLSAVSRCRATRESGDFIIGAAPVDGNPAPVNYSSTDRYCLDGQRLLSVAGGTGCASVAGMTSELFFTEIQSYQRVCAYTPNGGVNGVAFFTAERKDGSISWYGDRDNSATSNRPDGYVNSTASGKEAFALTWAQTRFQDSTGNYIDYAYHENPNGVMGEHLLWKVSYTGRTVLPGQTAPAQTPFAQLTFLYQTKAAVDQTVGYVYGGVVTQAHRLYAVLSESDGNQLRYYSLNYAPSPSGSGMDTLASVQECRDSTQAVCTSPTNFTWGSAKHEFATKEYPSNLPFGDIAKWRGFKQGDVDGDGRQDIVYIKEGSSGQSCPSEYIITAFSVLDAAGRPSYVLGPVQCTTSPGNLGISQRGDAGWHLLDYDGDGRDDLLISSPVGQGWRLYLSTGRGTGKVFDDTNNVIAGLSPAIPSSDNNNYQVQRTDLNGDGLTDLVYESGGMKARLMERQGIGFGFGAERAVVLQSTIPCGLCLSRSTKNWPDVGALQIYDLNGDGSSDLLMQTELSKELVTGDGDYRNEWYLEAFRVTEIGATTITFATQGYWLDKYYQRSSGVISSYDYIVQPKFSDINGDGLTDLFLKDTSNVWSYRLNTGVGFSAPVALGTIPYDQHLQLVDVNGDGRSDVAYVNTAYSGSAEVGKKYFARLALANGTISSSSVDLGGNAFLCEGYNCDPNQKVPMFGDFDADGNLDFMSLRLSTNPDLFVSRATDRFVPRDVITKVVNGFGAETEIAYAPLTLKDLYRPDNGTRNASNWGRGSPVQDMLAPMYVAHRVSSTSAQNGDPAAKSTVFYRYNGAKMQAGGRGFLGFREVVTIDPNQTGGYVTTSIQYAQNFPFIGLPSQTSKRAAINMVYAPPVCLSATPTDTCFAPRSTPANALIGTGFSQSIQAWEAFTDSGAAFTPGVQAPIAPRTAGTQEAVADPYSATQTSWVATAFTYGGYGNVVQTVVDSYTGISTTPTSTVITNNTYGDDVGHWRLGRLIASTVTHRRPGMADVVRNTAFAYAMTGPVTGLMTEERIQPNGDVRQDLRKAYNLDDYGNRVASFVCSQQVVDCRSTGLQYNLWQWDRIHRYSRQEYDANGRFPTRSFELFRPSNAATIDTTQPVEYVTAEVLARDVYGNVTEAVGLNDVRSVARFGTLGRPYYAWQQTDPTGSVPNANGTVGVSTTTTYRWCNSGNGAVSCPARARFRIKTMATSAPTQWAYYDLLGREVLKVAQTFNAGVADKDTTGVCTEYDAVGRAARISSPFFLSGTSASGEPNAIANICSDTSRKWTQTQFDVLGRPVQVTEPNLAVSSVAYSGLTTTSTNARGFSKVEVKNGLGELVQATDNSGLSTFYVYYADGTLGAVTRDAGRGPITTSMAYDALGRKVYMNDPDAGVRYIGLNAAGEQEHEHDGAGNINLQRMDFRGRVTWRGSYAQTTNGQVQEHSSLTNFDTASYGIGQENCSWADGLAYAAWQGQSDKTQVWSRCNVYDSMGRAIATATSIDGVSYSSAMIYNSLGRAQRSQDPSGKWLKTEYGARGQALRLCESSATDTTAGCAPGSVTTYLETHETDVFGNSIKDTRGGSAAMQTFRQYDPLTGRLNQICAGSSSTNCAIMRDSYAWDSVGNLSWRDRKDYAEEFAYDSIDRLVYGRITRVGSTNYANGTGQVTDWYHYDKLGNICGKPVQGTQALGLYYAGRAGCGLTSGELGGLANASQTLSPHQVLQAGIYTYNYDNRGNQTFADAANNSLDRTIRYNAQDQAYEVFKGTASAPNRLARFWYDPSGNRYKREDTGLGITGTRRTLYVGNLEIVSENGTTTYKRYIGGVLVQNVVNGISANSYLFQDHIGSVIAVTNENGAIQEGGGFNASGERRANGSATSITQTGLASTTRGFTGHEMLDGLDVIHMNGRIYDPTLGRFLQADPVIQDVTNPQSWNAYTYVFNNAYRYTDPTGMVSVLKKWWRPIVAIALSALTYGAASGWAAGWLASSVTAGTISAGAAAVVGGAVAGAAAGFVGGAISSGTIKGALRGAFSGALFGGIGGYYGDAWNWQRVTVESLAGGISSEAAGGDFADGFMMSFALSSLTLANYKMRTSEQELSSIAPDRQNLGSDSDGFFGDKTGMAGARRQYDKFGELLPCKSPAGGCQGQPILNGKDQVNNFFGIGDSYDAGSVRDTINESFAGPHDWLRNHVSRAYITKPVNPWDVVGNGRVFTGARKWVDNFANFSLIPVAAPFAGSALVMTRRGLYVGYWAHRHADDG